MNLIATILGAALSARSGRHLCRSALLSLMFLFVAPCWAQTWDYMAERERIEADMTDAERQYVREHSDSRESAVRAVGVVHRYRSIERTYETAGKLKTFVAFVMVSLIDVVQIGAVIVAVFVFRRWWLVIPASALIGATLWLPASFAGPSTGWTELALTARLLAAFLVAVVGISMLRLVLMSTGKKKPTP